MAACGVRRSDQYVNIHLHHVICQKYFTKCFLLTADCLLWTVDHLPLTACCCFTRCVFQTVSTAKPIGPIPGSAHSPRAAAAAEAASGSHMHRLHTSTGQHTAGPDAAGSPSREPGPLQAAAGSGAEQSDAVAAAAAPVGDDAAAVSAAEAAGERAVHAGSASFAVAADCPAIGVSLQGQAWAEQPACSIAGSLEDSTFVGCDLSVSEGVVHQTAAGQPHNRFRMPWLMAKGGSKASKVGLPSHGSGNDGILHD